MKILLFTIFTLLFIIFSPRRLPFGVPLGHSHSVIAFSNHRPPPSPGNTAYGKKWQCVEWVRRWLALTRGITFPPVKNAWEMWNLPHFLTTEGRPVTIHHTLFPSSGDVMVWGTERWPTGHVAIVEEVRGDRVRITEQNMDEVDWQGRSYAREISIHDRGVLGWISIP